jgi:glycosyltransferase involved in cell wall biosynthesis
MPTRNRRRLLERSLGTVLAQTGVELEVIVVDDGSRDDTASWVATVDDPRVCVVTHPMPRGVADARNSGIERARTPWVAFLDDDDLWAPTKLEEQLSAVNAAPPAGWACVGQVTLDQRLRIVASASPPVDSERVLEPLLMLNAVPGGGSGVLAATDLIRDVGCFDPRLSLLADWDLWIRLAASAPAAVVDRPLLGYVRHGANMSWDVSAIGTEFAIIDGKHAGLRADLGVRRDGELWSSWIADAERRSGNRWRAVAADLVQAGRARTPRPLLRAAVTAVSPAAWIEFHNRREARHVDPAWRNEADAWLEPIRAESANPYEVTFTSRSDARHIRSAGADHT